MHIGLAGLLFEDGDRDGARRELDTAHRIAPASHIRMVVNVNPATR